MINLTNSDICSLIDTCICANVQRIIQANEVLSSDHRYVLKHIFLAVI